MSDTTGARAAGTDAERSPEEIRADIEETREELGDTVAALADKTDVKGHAQQRVADVKAKVQHKREEFATKAKSTTPQSAQQGGQQMISTVKEHPAPVALAGAVLAGFLLGRLTSRNDDR